MEMLSAPVLKPYHPTVLCLHQLWMWCRTNVQTMFAKKLTGSGLGDEWLIRSEAWNYFMVYNIITRVHVCLQIVCERQPVLNGNYNEGNVGGLSPVSGNKSWTNIRFVSKVVSNGWLLWDFLCFRPTYCCKSKTKLLPLYELEKHSVGSFLPLIYLFLLTSF